MAAPGRKGFTFIVLLLLIGGTTLYFVRHKRPGISEREYATGLLASFLRENFHPKSVLVIGNPFSQMPNRPAQVYDYQKAGVAGLKAGLGSGTILQVDFPAISPAVLANPGSVQVDPRSPTPLSFLVESSAFDTLLNRYKDCDFAVSLIGLPLNVPALESWTRSGSPRFALLLPDWRMVGDAPSIQAAFASGKLVAAVVSRPNAEKVSELRDRYIVVHSNNVAQLLQGSPDLFVP